MKWESTPVGIIPATEIPLFRASIPVIVHDPFPLLSANNVPETGNSGPTVRERDQIGAGRTHKQYGEAHRRESLQQLLHGLSFHRSHDFAVSIGRLVEEVET